MPQLTMRNAISNLIMLRFECIKPPIKPPWDWRCAMTYSMQVSSNSEGWTEHPTHSMQAQSPWYYDASQFQNNNCWFAIIPRFSLEHSIMYLGKFILLLYSLLFRLCPALASTGMSFKLTISQMRVFPAAKNDPYIAFQTVWYKFRCKTNKVKNTRPPSSTVPSTVTPCCYPTSSASLIVERLDDTTGVVVWW